MGEIPTVYSIQGIMEIFGAGFKNVQEDGKINPLPPKEDLNNEEELKVGNKCIALGVETKNYRPDGYVQWTLVKKDGGKLIWAAHTVWGHIYVGYIEDGYHNLNSANAVCNKYEDIVLNGKSYSIKMTLPEIGFRYTSRNEKLNFELLKSLNYTSVVSNKHQNWLWARSPIINYTLMFDPVKGKVVKVNYNKYRSYDRSVRCVVSGLSIPSFFLI